MTTVSHFRRPLDDCFTFRTSTWRQFHVSEVHLTTVSRFGGPGGQFCKKAAKSEVPPSQHILRWPGEGHPPANIYSKWRLFCDKFCYTQTPSVMVNQYDSLGERYPSCNITTLFRSVFWQLFLQTVLFISWFQNEKKDPRKNFPLLAYIDFRGCPYVAQRCPAIDVNGIRSEPGNTRLSQDDGSIHKANSLKLILYYMILHYTTLYYMILIFYYIILHCITLYCIVL